MAWERRERSCPVCEASHRQVIGRRGGEAHRSRNGVETTVVRCRKCACLYTHPVLLPSSNPYTEHTAEAYFEMHDSERKKANGKRLARRAESILSRTGRMLEIGCGRGELLVGAKELGWEVEGIEMTHGFAKRAREAGVRIYEEPVENSRLREGRYDVILFAAVLEHLYEPAAVLRRARRALAPDGLVFIDVPNEASLTMRAGNLYMRLRGRDWAVNLSPTFSPYHVVGFSPKTLRYLLKKTGYRVHSLETTRWSNALPKPRDAVERLEHLGLSAFSWLGDRLGMGDGILCWAQADSAVRPKARPARSAEPVYRDEAGLP